jgi:hypothetical protein
MNHIDTRLFPLINLQAATADLLKTAKADLARGHMSQTPDAVKRIEDFKNSLDRRVEQIRDTLSAV